IFLFAFATGCKTRVSDQDAIRAGIEKHLSGLTGMNMSAMDREVKQVSINGDHATAQVEFRAKQGTATMQVEYTLDRQGAQWNVVGSQHKMGQNPRSGMDMPPPTSPGTRSNSTPTGYTPIN